MVGVIELAGDGCIGLDTVEQAMGEGDLVTPAGRDQADVKSQCLGGGVEITS